MGFFKKFVENLLSEPYSSFGDSNRAPQRCVPANSSAPAAGELRARSALPPGRMQKTDVIKGSKCNIPREPGAYRHIDKETKTVTYVGQTNDLRARQQQHARAGRLDTATQFVQYAVARPDATKDDLCRTEQCHISRHNPTGNKTKGGNGRR